MKIVKKLNMFCLLLLSVAMLSSCAKDREEKFLQGHGRDFEKVEDYTGGSFFVDTGDQLRAANLSVAEKLIVEPGVAKVNNLGLVQIKDTNAKLLGEIPFRGLPNTKYTIEYKLSPKYLKLYKVAPEEQIPFDEKTYGTLRPDGQWEIPLVGYEVDYYTHERQRNQYEEEGQYLVEVPVEDPSKAKYLKIRRLTRKVFDAITKVDTYLLT